MNKKIAWTECYFIALWFILRPSISKYWNMNSSYILLYFSIVCNSKAISCFIKIYPWPIAIWQLTICMFSNVARNWNTHVTRTTQKNHRIKNWLLLCEHCSDMWYWLQNNLSFVHGFQLIVCFKTNCLKKKRGMIGV